MPDTDLLSVLNRTGLQQKDPQLFQVLSELIKRPIAEPPSPPEIEAINIDTRNAAQSVYLATAIKEGVFYIITDMFGNAGTNPITLVGTVSGIVNPTISSNYGVIKVYADKAGYQFWGGTAAGTFGPGNPNKSVQYNDNGIFGGSVMQYDKALQTFGIRDIAYNYILIYGFMQALATASYGAEFDCYTNSNGDATGLFGFAQNDGANSPEVYGVTGEAHSNNGTPSVVRGLSGFAIQEDGSAEAVQGAFGRAIVEDGAVTTLEAIDALAILQGGVADITSGLGARATMTGGITDQLISLILRTEFSAGEVTSLGAGMVINPPIDGGTNPAVFYGLLVNDQSVAGMADADNWAALFLGSSFYFGIKATGIPNVSGLDGVSGSFVAGAKTITVTNGLITAIV